tara:strand:+ start:152 stop:586 length:435 start_codon:yes stop_codon:yes gene_type:complete
MTNINGIILSQLEIIKVDLGDIYHAMKRSDNGFSGFGEAYFSTIKTNAVKAWKKHEQMTLNIVVPVGEIKFVMYDERKNSSTYGEYQEVILSESNYKRLTIPPNLWLGFQGVSKSTSLLLNIASIEHSTDESIKADKSKISYNW